MKKNWKRMLSLLLTVCMIAGLLVLPAAAEGEGDVEGELGDTTATFAITVTDAENGSVVIVGDTDGEAAEGVTITVTATADDGYELDAITVTEEDGTEVTVDEDNTFTMPAKDVTINVTFKAEGGDPEPEEHTVTVTAGENGAATASVDKAVAGTEVTLTITPDTGYVVDQITSADVTVTDNKFTMPDKDVIITVTFKAEQGGNDPDPEERTVTVNAGANGTATASVDKAVQGTEVTLTITPDTGYVVDQITSADVTVTDNKFTMPAKDVTINVTFKEEGEITPPDTKVDLSAKTVSLDKTAPVVGDTITASVEGVAAADVDFVWTVGDTEVTDNKTATYTVAAADMGKVIKVKAQAQAGSAIYENATPEVSTSAVAAKTMTVTVTGYTGAYDGQAHGITLSGAPTGATVEYSTDGGSTWSTTAPTFTNVSTTTVNYKVTAAGYQEAAGSATVTITPAAAPVLSVAFDPEDVPAEGGDVDVTVTVSGVFGQDVLAVSVTLDGGTPVTLTKGDTGYTGKLEGIEATTEGKDLSVVVTATNANYENATQTETLCQLGANDVTPMPATGLKVSDVVDYAALGVTATADNNKVTYTIDEAALQAAWADAGKKDIIMGNAMNHDGVAYLCFTFEAPEGVGNTWKVSQKVNGTLEETKHTLDGTDTFDVWTVDGKMVIGDWFSIADIKGEELEVRGAATWNNVQYYFYEGDATEPTAIVRLNVERKVTAAPAEHTVTVNPGAGGDAKASVTKAAAGTEVTLTITPNTGYELKNISIVATNGESVTVKDNKFTMPASDVTVTVTFKAESGEEPTLPPLPAGDEADVVPGNLGQIDDDSDLPANGLATEYKVAAVKTAEGVTVQVTAATLTKHANAQEKAGFWIGFGMPIEEGKTYTYCLVENGVEGDPIASVPGRVQTVKGKDYNTIYFNLAAEDAGKLQEVVVKQTETEGDTATEYNVTILVNKLIDPLADAIAEAKDEVDSVETSTNGLDVSQSDQWVTQADKVALNAAITAAEAKLEGTMDEQKAAVDALKAAMETFKAAKKNGARPNPVHPPAYGPSGPSASASNNNDVVDKTSETLDDGTKRDTETAKDGTVTVTETKPNGTKTVTTTTPDGEITTDVTLGNGVKSATVAIPVKDADNGTVAVIVKDDGTEEIIRSSKVEDGNVVFELNRDAKVKIVNNAKKFVDITNHWAKDYVDYVTAREFFNGVDATHFSPDTAMTRAMLATVLFRLVGETSVDGTASYKDVAAGTWYTDAVNWASKVGVVNGYPDGTFAPNRAITREELVVMFYRYAGSPEVDDMTSLVAFQDADQVSSWAETAMRWAVKNGIINGKSVDTLLPRGNATRAEVSAVLQRYVNLAK